MRTRLLLVLIVIAFLQPLVTTRSSGYPDPKRAVSNGLLLHIPAPEEVLGFVPGDDRKLASWAKVIEYFTALSRTSDRVKFETLGESTMGNPFVMATISAPENLARLQDYKNIQAQLADPRMLGAAHLRDDRAAELVRKGKTIVLITCGIHSTEVGSYLSSTLIAHRLATSDSAEIQNILRNTIILLVPSLNPDGVDIVKNWYDKTLGTPYEGTSPPELYHKYVGHDDNRDWYAFTQVETQIAVDKIHNVWHPQIVHDIHQQGEFNARFFLPPYMPPVEPNVPKQIVDGYTELGEFMAREMRVAHFTGITTNSTYDAWSPSRAYSHYHGGVRILSETASCKIATPITVKFSELKKDTGYDPQNESATYGPLWSGGEWHLRDITSYMTTAAFLLLRHASENRAEWLNRFYEIGKDAVRPRRNGELFGFVGADVCLMETLTKGGVEFEGIATNPLYERKDLGYWRLTESPEVPGTSLIRMDQPYGRFAKALLESQNYPNLRDAFGHPISPYDVTAHTLPLLFGRNVIPVLAPFKYKRRVISDPDVPCPRKSGPILISGRLPTDPDVPRRERIVLYRSQVPAIDEGWTRWWLESSLMKKRLSYGSLEDKELRSGNLKLQHDTIIIPDQAPEMILNGYKTGAMPAELTGGLGTAGVKALREFVEQGGTLVCLNRASSFAIEQFKLLVRDVVANVSEKEFFAPGSILRIELNTTSPLATGMPRESIAWVEDSPVFEVVTGAAGVSGTAGVSPAMSAKRELVNVIARYPANRNPLLSGWLLGEKRIRGKAALVEVEIGKGRIILFGFRPQYRGQSLATYPLFFNAIRNAIID